MFDATGAFEKQFTPANDGYIYYPSRRGGGKLVNVAEHEQLVSQWQRVAGMRGQWKTVGVAFVAIIAWVLLSQALHLPEWANSAFGLGCALAISGWIMWASFAPWRLVRDRPDVVPPRPLSESRRAARAALNWPFIIFFLLFSGAIFAGSVWSSDRTITSWAWTLGSGLFFGLYAWIAIQKLSDRPR